MSPLLLAQGATVSPRGIMTAPCFKRHRSDSSDIPESALPMVSAEKKGPVVILGRAGGEVADDEERQAKKQKVEEEEDEDSSDHEDVGGVMMSDCELMERIQKGRWCTLCGHDMYSGGQCGCMGGYLDEEDVWVDEEYTASYCGACGFGKSSCICSRFANQILKE